MLCELKAWTVICPAASPTLCWQHAEDAHVYMTSSDLSRELHMHTTQFPTPITHLWVCLADVSNLTCPPPHPCFPTSDLSPSTCIFPISKEYHYPPIISIRKLEILVLSYFSLNPLHFYFPKANPFLRLHQILPYLVFFTAPTLLKFIIILLMNY